ncbi:MAG: GntR family transcriptional regulator [Lachnospiraceae bacterium]|nr:GntR family transcriptional regulator [Lachnospiraceae bacterium]
MSIEANNNLSNESNKNTGLAVDSATPLYTQIINKIRSQISSGILNVGDMLPPETELCNRYSVSRITVRKALFELEKQGILERKQGKGTFISVPTQKAKLNDVNSFHDTCRMNGKKASTKVLQAVTLPASKRDCTNLGIAENGRVVETVRLHFADGVPVIMEENHFSMAYSYLLESDLSSSLYGLLRECGVEPSQAIHEVSLKPATPSVAKYLKVSEGTRLLYLHEIIYDKKGRPLHTSCQYIRGDIFTFRI